MSIMQLSQQHVCLPKPAEKTSEHIRNSIINSIEKYINSPHYESLQFSTSLSSKDRAFVRLISEQIGLKHSTFGNKTNRQIIVQKWPPLVCLKYPQLTLSWDSRRSIIHLLQNNPISSKELECLRPYQEDLFSTGSSLEGQKCITGRLMGAVPQIPVAPFLGSSLSAACPFEYSKPAIRTWANELPIRMHRNEIFRVIANEQVVIVAGPQGCGKSTQMPQMLLEECCHRAQHCRAICTQPRRLVAHANADRVAAERGETVGQSIGYQIHLESKVSPKTLLTFCTHAVLLRTIYGDPTLLNSTTHIIIDEIEEEDIFSRTVFKDGTIKQRFISNDVSSQTCNLLLGIMHQILPKYPHLKIILLVNLKSTSVILCQNANIGLSLARLELPTPGAFLNVNWRTLTQEANSTMLADLPAIRNEEQEPMLQVILPKIFPKEGDHEPTVYNFLLAPQYKKAPVIWIPTVKKRPEVYFLEDILQWLDIQSSEMELTRRLLEKDESKARRMHYWLTGVLHTEDTDPQKPPASTGVCDIIQKENSPAVWSLSEQEGGGVPIKHGTDTEYDFQNSADKLIWSIWENLVLRAVRQKREKSSASLQPQNDGDGPQKNQIDPEMHRQISDLLQSVMVGWISVDCRHSETGITPLMLFAAAGHLDLVERLLSLGADVFIRVALPRAALPPTIVTIGTVNALSGQVISHKNSEPMVGANAYDLARLYGHAEIASLLKAQMAAVSLNHTPDDWEANLLRFGSSFLNPVTHVPKILQPQNRCELERNIKFWKEAYPTGLERYFLYQICRSWSHPNTLIDFNLVTNLIVKIDATMPPGAILVFLPSYEEILTMKEHLSLQTTFKRQKWICVLHFRMLVQDLKQVFVQPPQGVRKIVLTTSIAENSMAIDDVAYVVDTGVIRKREFFENTGTFTSRNHWIGYASSFQRQYCARTNSNTICFRVYSKLRFSALEMTLDDTEALRCCQYLEELCLQGKLLTPREISLKECLQSIPRAPTMTSFEHSVRALRIEDAFDAFDSLTELGFHMCDLPLPPRYSKMVLISIALKCVDPVLTIACILAYEDPFTIPGTASERREALAVRKKFSADSLSDHMVLLRAFQFWQKARFEGWEHNFCKKNFISTAVFEIVISNRTQLLGQLRASGFVKARGSGDIRDLNTNSENWAVVKAALVAGMYGNLAKLDRHTGEFLLFDSSLDVPLDQEEKSTYKARPSPLSVLANNGEGIPSDLKVLPSDWIVFDKIIGQRPPCEDISRTNLGVGHGRCTSGKGRQNGQQLPGRPTVTPKVLPHYEQKLLTCVTVISPITAAILSGPVRTKITCVPSGGNELSSSDNQLNGDPKASFRSSVLGSGLQSILHLINFDCLPDSDDEDVSISERLEREDKVSIITKQIRPYLFPQDNAVENIEKADQSSSRLSSRYQALHHEGDGTKRVTVHLDGPNGILTFDCELEVAKLIIDLRQKWNCLLLRRLRNPSKQSLQQDEAILSTIVTVLTAEEQALGLRQPTGVGARPRPMVTELCNYLEPSDASAEASRLSGLDGEQPRKSWPNNNSTEQYPAVATTEVTEVPRCSQNNNCPAAVTKNIDSQNQMTTTDSQWSQTFSQPKPQPFQGAPPMPCESRPPMTPEQTLLASHCECICESLQTNLEDGTQQGRYDSQFSAYQEIPSAPALQDQYAWQKTAIFNGQDCLAQSLRKVTLDSVQEPTETCSLPDFQQNPLMHHRQDNVQQWESQFYTFLATHIDDKGTALSSTEKCRQVSEVSNSGDAAIGERIQSKSPQSDTRSKPVSAGDVGMLTAEAPIRKQQSVFPYLAEIKYSKGYRF